MRLRHPENGVKPDEGSIINYRQFCLHIKTINNTK
jgi:hypothetical protein